MHYGNAEIRRRLLEGQPLHFSEELLEESRTIPAEWLADTIRNEKPVDIDRAVVAGTVNLKYVEVKGELTVRRSVFRDSVDFSYATFQRVVDFHGTTFCNDAEFKLTRMESEVSFQEVIFKGKVEFRDANIKGFFNCRWALIEQANFQRVSFEKSVSFLRTTFNKKADFLFCSIGGNATFTAVTFKGPAVFDRAKMAQNALFDPAIFEQDASFLGIQIGGSAHFDSSEPLDVRFGAIFQKDVSFNMSVITGACFFGRAAFGGEANFGSASMGEQAAFLSARFQKQVNFDAAEIKGKALFQEAHFSGPTFFVSTAFHLGADFAGAIFEDVVSFQAASLSIEAHFDQGVSASWDLPDSPLSKPVPPVDFRDGVDLRGCTYDRINVPALNTLLQPYEQLMESNSFYDRQPYIQLEKTLRTAGDSSGADSVYSRRRSLERKKKTGLHWFGDAILWALVGYGVNYWLLCGWIFFIVLFGSLVFDSEGSVRPAVEIDPDKPIPEPIVTACDDQMHNCDINIVEAAGVSLNTFLPIQLPIGETWEPSYVIFASLMKLAGWIIVPVGVAAISGLLKREGTT
jgi:uncharacterized protein YjbI with pentapeptide repeats